MNGHPNPEEANPIAPVNAKLARRWSLVVTIAAATMATGLSYIFIVQFFVDVTGMPLWQAAGFGGVLEVCLVAAGLQARERILSGADAGVLITLTWVFSGTSAAVSASHEVVTRTADGSVVLDLTSGAPVTMIVRAVAPLAAAVMWHLLLIGEKHMVSGRPRSYRKHAALMHTYMLAREEHRDLAAMGAEAETVESARRAMNAARAEVFRKVPTSSYQLLLEERINAMAADFDGSARVDRMSEVRKPAPVRKPLPGTERATQRRRVAGPVRKDSASAPVPDSGIRNPEPEADHPVLAVVPEPRTDLDTEARNLTILELDRQGEMTQKEIAAHVGVTDRTVRNVLAAAKPSA